MVLPKKKNSLVGGDWILLIFESIPKYLGQLVKHRKLDSSFCFDSFGGIIIHTISQFSCSKIIKWKLRKP